MRNEELAVMAGKVAELLKGLPIPEGTAFQCPGSRWSDDAVEVCVTAIRIASKSLSSEAWIDPDFESERHDGFMYLDNLPEDNLQSVADAPMTTNSLPDQVKESLAALRRLGLRDV